MHTVNVDGASVDMGAMVVTGVPGNPIAAIAKQTRSRVHNLTKDCSLYLSDGRPVCRQPTHIYGVCSLVHILWRAIIDQF